MKKSLLILITLFTVFIGYSQTFNALDNNNNTLEYDITTATTVEVRDYVSGGTDIDMPSTVDNPNDGMTYNVTTIGNFAFQNNNLTSVIIPDSVISIGTAAFIGNALTSATIGTNVQSIGTSAFINNQLTSIYIPLNVVTIGNSAFEGNMFTNITIPNSVTSIGNRAFKGNPLTCVISEAITPPVITTAGLEDSFSNTGRSNINLTIPSGTLASYTAAQWTGFNSVSEGLSGTFVVDNITYQINATPNNEVTVTDYNTAGGTIVIIPNTVTSGCTDFSVTDIGINAFLSNNLTSVVIPDSVINIGQGAFNNNNINNLVLGNNVESIGNWSFQNNNLTSVTIPDSVTSIAVNAFRQNSITNLVLGNSVETIGNYAFGDNDIASVVIPDSVLTIGTHAFVYSDGMTNLVIGNSVTSIGEFAFAMNGSLAQLTSIIIPSSVTTIGDYAFSITSLTDVFSESTTPPTIITGTNDTFNSISNRGTINLHIPPNTTGVYVSNTGALWTDFMTVTEDALLSTSGFELANDIKIITTTDAIKVLSSNNVKLKNYTIYNITGTKVTTGKENEISTSTFTSGIYILKLDFNNGTVTKKVAIN